MDTPVKLKLDINVQFFPSNQTPTEIIKTESASILYTLIYNLLKPTNMDKYLMKQTVIHLD